MAELISIPLFSDLRGNLGVIEDSILPFPIKRVYWISGVPSLETQRGGHRHKKTSQALVCISGKCRIENDDGRSRESFLLDSPRKCLLLDAKDWHKMTEFTPDAVLLVLASENYTPDDYIDEPYGRS